MSAIVYTPMTVIKLSGSLARKFGREHHRQIDSGETWETFKSLMATLAGFEDEIKRLDGMGLRFAIFRNRKNVGTDDFARCGTREVRIVPVVGGSKRGGLLQTIIGVAMIAAVAIFAPAGLGAIGAGGAWGITGAIGVSLAVGGVIQMLSPQAQGLVAHELPVTSVGHRRAGRNVDLGPVQLSVQLHQRAGQVGLGFAPVGRAGQVGQLRR